jgi:hypothetical protein
MQRSGPNASMTSETTTGRLPAFRFVFVTGSRHQLPEPVGREVGELRVSRHRIVERLALGIEGRDATEQQQGHGRPFARLSLAAMT